MPIDSIQTQTIRNEQAKASLEHAGEKNTRELKEKNRNELARLVEHHSTIKEDLEKAFELSLSTMADSHEKRLTEARQAHEKQLEDEKSKGEDALEKMRNRYSDMIARYRENSEKTLHEMHKQTEDSVANIKRARERGKT